MFTEVLSVADTDMYCAPKFKSNANPESPPPNTHWYPAKAPPEKVENPMSVPAELLAEETA